MLAAGPQVGDNATDGTILFHSATPAYLDEIIEDVKGEDDAYKALSSDVKLLVIEADGLADLHAKKDAIAQRIEDWEVYYFIDVAAAVEATDMKLALDAFGAYPEYFEGFEAYSTLTNSEKLSVAQYVVANGSAADYDALVALVADAL